MSLMKKLLVISLSVALIACGKTESAEKSALPVGSDGKTVQAESTSEPRVSRDPALNAAPLGIEIGFANLAGVKQKLGSITTLKDAGTNEHSGGVMLGSDGDGLGVDGLSNFVAIFDKNGTLAGVIMTLPKNINDTYSKLSGKYKTVNNNIDEFMGNGSAKLEKGDSWILIEAPHLSFGMDIVYGTKAFIAGVQNNNAQAKAKKEQAQKDSL